MHFREKDARQPERICGPVIHPDWPTGMPCGRLGTGPAAGLSFPAAQDSALRRLNCGATSLPPALTCLSRRPEARSSAPILNLDSPLRSPGDSDRNKFHPTRQQLELLRYLAVELDLRPSDAIAAVETAAKFKRRPKHDGCRESSRRGTEHGAGGPWVEMETVVEVQHLLADALGLGPEEYGKIIVKYPLVLGVHSHSVELVLEFLREDLELSRRDIARIVTKKPEVLCYGISCLRSKVEYLRGPWGGDDLLALEEVGKLLRDKPQLLSQPVLKSWAYEDLWDSG